MSRQAVTLCMFAVLLQWLLLWNVVSADLTPPVGYSLAFAAATGKGSQIKYVCKRGSWTVTSATADFFNAGGRKLGSYWAVYDQRTQTTTFYWNIMNSAGASIETSSNYDGLQATPVSTVKVSPSAISEYMAIVRARRGGPGDSARIGYVSLTGTQGGVPPRKALCTVNGATLGVPFKGTFKFYNLDLLPPKVPASLDPKGTFVQVIFLQGKMQYKFTRSAWRFQGIYATLFDVPGGKTLGKFGTVATADKFGSKLFWQVDGPNGFWLAGQQCARPLQLSRSGCAWQLLTITSSGGTPSPLGKYTKALLGGTLGGLPPRTAARTEGVTWGSEVSALIYLFTA